VLELGVESVVVIIAACSVVVDVPSFGAAGSAEQPPNVITTNQRLLIHMIGLPRWWSAVRKPTWSQSSARISRQPVLERLRVRYENVTHTRLLKTLLVAAVMAARKLK
jgi:hypothetical protein